MYNYIHRQTANSYWNSIEIVTDWAYSVCLFLLYSSFGSTSFYFCYMSVVQVKTHAKCIMAFNRFIWNVLNFWIGRKSLPNFCLSTSWSVCDSWEEIDQWVVCDHRTKGIKETIGETRLRRMIDDVYEHVLIVVTLFTTAKLLYWHEKI